MTPEQTTVITKIMCLDEEVDEFIEDPCLDEAADMLEVVRTFVSINGIDFDDVMAAAHIKKCMRGSFARGVVLEKVNR